MRILLSNDDGYLAPGLVCLAEGLGGLGSITVVAPDRDRSGASNSLTLDRPIRATEGENGFIRVNGTPTDCVHLAITGLLDHEPDIVISGINNGGNLGDDVIYSGTVAAAVEGRYLGFPAIAVSLAGRRPHHYASGLEAVRRIVQRLQRERLAQDLILNVNVPDRPWGEIRGFRVTRLGFRHKAEPVIPSTDPRGNPIYWIGSAGPEYDAGPGTDFHAIREGFVSVTPLQVDLTRHFALDALRSWMENIEP